MSRAGFAVQMFALLIGMMSGCGPDLSPPRTAESPADAGAAADLPPELDRPRLIVRVDPTTGRRELWDDRAQAVCERQPLCASCTLPWDQNPMYCVPVELTPFALGDWYADPFCSVHLYGLPAAQNKTPRWAYQFDETRMRAKVYRVQPAPLAVTARPYKADLYDPRVPCDLATANDIAAATRNFKLYVQVEEAPPEQWMPWGEAQKVLGAAP